MKVFTLVRIAFDETGWQPKFALRYETCELLVRGGTTNKVLTWPTAREAFSWVELNHPTAAVVWEGTTY